MDSDRWDNVYDADGNPKASNSPNVAAGERCEHCDEDDCLCAPTCTKCRDPFNLREGGEDVTRLCDPCAQEEVVDLRAQLATVREAHDEARRALALKDSYKAERDEYAKSATALRTALATEQAAHEATQRERDCERDKAAVNFASCERLKAERDRAEAALATVAKAIAAIEISEYAGRGVVVCRRCNAASSTLTGIKHEPECDAPALAAAPRAGETECGCATGPQGHAPRQHPDCEYTNHECAGCTAPPTSTAKGEGE